MTRDARRVRDPGHPRRPASRSDHRRRRHAHLPDVHLRPGRGGSPPGLRVQPQRQPDPDGLGAVRGRPRGGAAAWPSPAAWPAATPSCACCDRATTSCYPTTPTAGPTGWSAQVHAPAGIAFDPVEQGDLDRWRRRGGRPPSWSGSRSPTNPLLSIADIAAVSAFAHRRGALVAVDNTFATPYLQRPLELGADIVIHSTTKYLGGHSDVVGGVVVVDDDVLAARLAFLQNAAGGVPGPFDCFLTLRGIKTLAVRMDRHSLNAAAVADLLVSHPKVAQVVLPRPSRSPRPRRRRQADGRLRGHGFLHRRRRGTGRPRRGPAHQGVHPGRVPRCGRVAHRAPPPHDPRLGGRARRSPSIRPCCGCPSAWRPPPICWPT